MMTEIKNSQHDEDHPGSATLDSSHATEPPQLFSFNILLLGRTGQGKSATGNKLISIAEEEDDSTGLEDQSDSIWQPYTALKAGYKKSKQLSRFIESQSSDIHSCTKHCAFLVNLKTKIGVLDTPGFGDSHDARQTDLTIEQINLSLVRKILIQQLVHNLEFDCVLYFIPVRGAPEKSDAYILDDLKTFTGLIGEDIFQNLVLVMTVGEIESKHLCDDTGDLKPECLKDYQQKCKLVYSDALNAVGINTAPPIIFIGQKESGASILKKVKDTHTNDSKMKKFKVKFKEDTCIKCAAKLTFLKGGKNCQQQSGIVSVIYETKTRKKVIEHAYSRCHPMFVPEYTTLAKFFGTCGHVLSLGTVAIYQWFKDTTVMPSLFSSDEICVYCKGKPGMKEPCTKVNEKRVFQGKEIKCEHSSKL